MSTEAQKTPVAATAAAQDNAAMTPEAKAAKMNSEIRKSWDKLSDEDAKLFPAQADKFFEKLKEKQGVSKEDGQKRLDEIKASCGGCTAEKAA